MLLASTTRGSPLAAKGGTMGEKWWSNGAWDMHPGFFYMPQIFWRKACWGFLSPCKNPTASAGFEPANLGIRGLTNNILRDWIFKSLQIIRYPFEILTSYYILNAGAVTLTCSGNRTLLDQSRTGIIGESACRLCRTLVCVSVSFGQFRFYLHI